MNDRTPVLDLLLIFAVAPGLGWNFFQGPFLGFAISGDSSHTAWIRLLDVGPAWLTGGAFGPEAGVIAAPAILFGLFFIAWRYPKAKTLQILN